MGIDRALDRWSVKVGARVDPLRPQPSDNPPPLPPAYHSILNVFAVDASSRLCDWLSLIASPDS